MEPEHEQLASASMKAIDNASSNGLSTGFPAPSTDASQIEYEPSTNVLEKEDNHQLSELRDSLESNQLKSLLDLLELDIGELSNSQGQLASSSLNLKLELLLQDRSVQAVIAFQKLADICRHEEWRIPLAKVGLLQTATNVLRDEIPQVSGWEHSRWLELQIQAIRLIGNICADIDDNRRLALRFQTLPLLLGKFKDNSLAKVAIPAAFNICNDFDSAKDAAIEAHLFTHCLRLLESDILKTTPTFSYICLLLDIVHDKVDAKDAPENALQTLIKFSLKGDLEIAERLSLLHLTNKILALEENQRDLIDRAQVELGLGTLFRTYSEALDPMEVILSGVGQTRSEEPEEEKELVNARSTLVHLLSDISAQPEFAKKYEISMDPSTIAWKLKQAMISPVLNISQAACLMLGNLACTDDICIRMVKNIKIHEAASMVLKDAKDVQLLHAVLGLLRNLALPKDNKDSLATVGVIENLQRCWSMDINPQIQLAAASLIRQLAAGSITNTRRLLLVSRSLNDDNDATQTQLMCLMKVYEKSDQLPMRTEIARTIVALLRSIYSQVVDEATRTSILAEFYSSSNNLELPLIGMITQTQHHVVRSEGWFALGLLSKDRSGRGMILRHVSEPGFMDLLRNTILESVPLNTQPELKGVEVGSAPAAPHNGITSTKDRENAMVVVYELTKFEGVDNASINEELRLDLFQLLGYESDKHV